MTLAADAVTAAAGGRALAQPASLSLNLKATRAEERPGRRRWHGRRGPGASRSEKAGTATGSDDRASDRGSAPAVTATECRPSPTGSLSARAVAVTGPQQTLQSLSDREFPVTLLL